MNHDPDEEPASPFQIDPGEDEERRLHAAMRQASAGVREGLRQPPFDGYWDRAKGTGVFPYGRDRPDPWGPDDTAGMLDEDKPRPDRLPVLDRDALDALEPPTAAVAGVLYAGTTAWIAGRAGSYKSFLAVDLACSVATGRPWQGCPVDRAPVLYMAGEGVYGIRARVRAWEQHNETRADGVYWVPRAVRVDTERWGELAQVAIDLHVGMVFIDTQARSTVGLDENSASEMTTYAEAVTKLARDTGACVVTVHHAAKSGEALRGSTAIEGAADTILAVVRDDSGVITLSNPKQKDAEPFAPRRFRLLQVAESAVLAEEPPQ